MVELETVLCGTVTMQELAEFFKQEGFPGEQYLVRAIKRYLRTDEQKKIMFDHDFSIEEMLNGRVEGEEADAQVDLIFADWNTRLGHRAFNF